MLRNTPTSPAARLRAQTRHLGERTAIAVSGAASRYTNVCNHAETSLTSQSRQEKTTSPHGDISMLLDSSLFWSTRSILQLVHPNPPCEFAMMAKGCCLSPRCRLGCGGHPGGCFTSLGAQQQHRRQKRICRRHRPVQSLDPLNQVPTATRRLRSLPRERAPMHCQPPCHAPWYPVRLR